MINIEGTETEKNLLKAYVDESQTKNSYEFYAKQAEKEGYMQIADIFRKTAMQKQSHAKQFFKYMEGREVEITATYSTKKAATTEDNLKAAVISENEKRRILFIEYIKKAKEEGFKEIAALFKIISKVQSTHEHRFFRILLNMEQKKVFKKDEAVKWECRKCGYEYEGEEAPKLCPACLHSQAYFEIEANNY